MPESLPDAHAVFWFDEELVGRPDIEEAIPVVHESTDAVDAVVACGVNIGSIRRLQLFNAALTAFQSDRYAIGEEELLDLFVELLAIESLTQQSALVGFER